MKVKMRSENGRIYLIVEAETDSDEVALRVFLEKTGSSQPVLHSYGSDPEFVSIATPE